MSDMVASVAALLVGLFILNMLGSRVLAPSPKGRRRRRSKPSAFARKNALRREGRSPAGVSVKETEAKRGGKRTASEQLEKVMASSFTAKPLLSKREARVAVAAREILAEIAPTWQIAPQVALGEVLRSDCKSAYWTVNAKRCDMLIVDEVWAPIAAIEYQGTGHHQRDAAARDAVKREALRRAGIDWIEVTEGDRPDQLRAALASLARARNVRAAA
ncbi:MAG: DUF2726 domain-containing protein [Pacificimonas sp.]